MSGERAADIVFTGGGVYTVDATRRWAEAVAVRDGRIVAVGTVGDVRAHIGPGTDVVDLDGKMLLPGFQDAHIHASGGGLERIQCDLSGAHSLDEYVRIIREYADRTPDREWILGGGWAMDVFPGGVPRKEDLDEVVPGRPVFLSNRDHHAAWVSTRTLELAGIASDTPDPVDGRVERDERGDPVGTLQEGAMDLARRFVPDSSPEDQRLGILEGQRYLHSLGITAWQEAIVGDYAVVPDCFDAYVALSETGELTGRVIGALWWERGKDEDQIEGLIERRARAGRGRFRATSIKIMQDGVCENFTAALLKPYLDEHGESGHNTGLSYFDPESLKRHVTRIDREGFQVHVHAIGDRAVREALDAIEAARRANGMRDTRPHIAHIQVVHPDDLARFRGLGVTANAQPLWAAYEPQMTELTIPFLGQERAAWQYPFGSLWRSGAALAFGSDWPVSSPNPLWELSVAVNRTMPPDYPYAAADGSGDEPFLPEQRLDLPTAIAAFTMGSAYVNHLEGETGSIEVGKAADLVVLDRNLFRVGARDIAGAQPLLTLVEGQRVFEAPGL